MSKLKCVINYKHLGDNNIQKNSIQRISQRFLHHAARNSDDRPTTCVVRSSSGDIDIPIILLGIQPIRNLEIYINNGSGKTRKSLHFNSCSLTSLEKTALVGNDYVSSFLCRGKPLCWKQASANPIFLDIFSQLGTETHVSEELFGVIENLATDWIEEAYPEDVSELLVERDAESEGECEEEDNAYCSSSDDE
ncbi:Hypothetical predicted protein [Paramuricea clavata]|uniref:Uncharacterized protein n=1 Tax=Paramuricea clavata TaxID=317549 RepID=A0A7D9HE48_PARCT|nr:Hypothetical predicted protein [Paramuricea clavata]